jgi:hypothetical protein
MNTQNHRGANSTSMGEAEYDPEVTLRLIASLPAPDGIENRVIANIRSAPPSRRVFNWPRLINPTEGWLRTAAAAAIVSVVLGGGWGVYSRIQPISTVALPNAGTAGGFSNAGAVRVPQTIPTPVVTKPASGQPAAAEPAKKTTSRDVAGAHRQAAHKAPAHPQAAVGR